MIVFRDVDHEVYEPFFDSHNHVLLAFFGPGKRCYREREAEDWARSQDAHYEALRQANLRRTAWKTQYFEFAGLTEKYVVWQKDTFLEFLSRYNLIDSASKVKCPVYEAHKLGSRGFEDVLQDDEITLVHEKLKEISLKTAEFWWVLLHTGMRFNELYSMPMSGLFKGNTKGALHEELIHQKVEYVGYLVLKSQNADDSRRREPDKSLKRKPLKGRKKISLADSRTVPITDKETWKILARTYREQKKLLEKGDFGTSTDNYMLFETLHHNEARISLRQAYEKIGLTPKDFHCLRHTYSTRLVGKTSFFLARAILGHKTEKMFDRYCHIFEQIQMEAQQQSQEIDEI